MCTIKRGKRRNILIYEIHEATIPIGLLPLWDEIKSFIKNNGRYTTEEIRGRFYIYIKTDRYFYHLNNNLIKFFKQLNGVIHDKNKVFHRESLHQRRFV